MNEQKYKLYSSWNKDYKYKAKVLLLELAGKYQEEVQKLCSLYGLNFTNTWVEMETSDAQMCFEVPHIKGLTDQAESIGKIVNALEPELVSALSERVFEPATEEFIILASVVPCYEAKPKDYEWVYIMFPNGYHNQPQIVVANQTADKDECLAWGPISRQLAEALIEMREYEPLSYWIRTIQELF